MNCVKDILNSLDIEFKFDIQEKWDNSGFQFGNLDSEVTGIVLTMDITESSIVTAINNKCNLIISHHPLFFEKIYKLDSKSGDYKKLRLLFDNDINVISLHTPLDLHFNGVSKALNDICMLENSKIFVKNGEDKGYGYIGEVEGQLFINYLKKLKDKTDLDNIIYYGNESEFISKVGVMGGSGAFLIKDAIDAELDLLITADIKYHDIQMAIENDLKLIDLGHYETEIYGLNKLKTFLENNLDINVILNDVNSFRRKII